ncbi:MAG: DUF2800 domain-containing protein [Fibrobacter sp.]|nr:DUF2800 domain-containing protein [Fibrobacter sp.]
MQTERKPLSPSAAARWLACPGSEYIIRQLPPLPSTPAAEEGTLAHAFAARAVWQALRDVCEAECINDGEPEEPEAALATEDMLNCAQIYADTIVAKLAQWDGVLSYSIEHPVAYLDVSQEQLMRGRLDFAALSKDKKHILVADYKFGGVHVPVKDNPQLLAYAACIAQPAERHGVRPDVTIGIVQPRTEAADFAEYAAFWHTYTYDEFTKAAWKVVEGATTAIEADEKTPRATGDHCKYCPARSVCRARIGERLLLAAIAAGEAQMQTDATNEQIGLWLDALKEVETAREDLSRIAKARITEGGTIPGWRIQMRKGKAWKPAIFDGLSTPEEQAGALGNALGVDGVELLNVSLKSPAQAAKALPKASLVDAIDEVPAPALVKA